MTTALERGEWSAACPGRTLPPGKTRYPLYRRLGGPQGRSGQVRKISYPTGIRSPDRSQSLYRLSYPAHIEGIGHLKSPSTLPEIGAKTSRLVAQCLNTLHCSPPMRPGVRGNSSHGKGRITHVIVAACNEVTNSSEASIGIQIPKIRFRSSGMWSRVLERVFPAVSKRYLRLHRRKHHDFFENVVKYELNDTAS
jgi:hypothetical protein